MRVFPARWSDHVNDRGRPIRFDFGRLRIELIRGWVLCIEWRGWRREAADAVVVFCVSFLIGVVCLVLWAVAPR